MKICRAELDAGAKRRRGGGGKRAKVSATERKRLEKELAAQAEVAYRRLVASRPKVSRRVIRRFRASASAVPSTSVNASSETLAAIFPPSARLITSMRSSAQEVSSVADCMAHILLTRSAVVE